ncbi:SAM-dependent methyltransferase [Thiomicrorhabdus aquaedulcis]|uniref:SAM-dependent methyltransferase n=1 Tax=Thiomicrorhabdus aquaedulcis TaxID=2211106 RepID=UPI000FDC988C|nr:cyclopropane-fatty-acyl-phospholipid synthase family protein [Thiomicrorhabdus aquaedulcis]
MLFSLLFDLKWVNRLASPLIAKLPFKHIQFGSLTLNVSGNRYRFEGEHPGHHAELTIFKPLRTLWLLKTQGELGFAQAYFEHAIDTHSLYHLMHLMYANSTTLSPVLSHKTLNLWHLWQHRKRHNSLKNSQKNISFHYDLGNDFYALWLDKTMSYSSGFFADDQHTLSLEQAQHLKYQRMLNALNVQADQRILEIGCGWGGMMEATLQRGAHIKGLTLSHAQQAYTQTRLTKLDTVEATNTKPSFEVALQDYRLETDTYDCIISIEMFEAVGKEYWDTYFAQLQANLKPGGKAALQIITIDEQHAQQYQSSVDFIQTYIFPGGLLPSLSQLSQLAHQHQFELIQVDDFGTDYAKTCQLWKTEFNRHSESLARMGYDLAFQKLWNYYLDYCTVGFETQHISVCQIVLQKPALTAVHTQLLAQA